MIHQITLGKYTSQEDFIESTAYDCYMWCGTNDMFSNLGIIELE